MIEIQLKTSIILTISNPNIQDKINITNTLDLIIIKFYHLKHWWMLGIKSITRDNDNGFKVESTSSQSYSQPKHNLLTPPLVNR